MSGLSLQFESGVIMTTNRDEERMKLAEKLDADLEAFVETKLAEQRPRVEDEDNRSIDEIAAVSR